MSGITPLEGSNQAFSCVAWGAVVRVALPNKREAGREPFRDRSCSEGCFARLGLGIDKIVTLRHIVGLVGWSAESPDLGR